MKRTPINLFSGMTMILLLMLCSFNPLIAQDAPQSLYLEMTKVKADNEDFLAMEKELATPFVQERIKQGNQLFRAVFRVYYPNGDDQTHDYVTMDGYGDFAHLNMGWDAMVKTAHAAFPNADMNKMGKRWESAAHRQGSEVFVVRAEAFPGPASGSDKPAKFVVANHMKVAGNKVSEYIAMESEMAKPIHQARAKAGGMNDWVMAQRVMPNGTEYPYNFITFDIYSDWSQMANTGDNITKAFATAHPGKDMNAAIEKMISLREIGRSEVWELVSFVDQPAAEATYDVVKEGTGPSIMPGQEVTYRFKLMNEKGEELISSDQLGFHFHNTVGANPYDRVFDKGVKQLKKGGIMNITLPPELQDDNTKGMTGGETAVWKVEVVDIGMPAPNGATMLKNVINEHGLATAKEKYKKLQSSNPDGYVFREADMNNLGYELMAAGKTDAAVYIFDLNQKNYPKSWNACDSLADGYRAAGNHAKAKECYKMALNINPDFKASKDKLDKMQ